MSMMSEFKEFAVRGNVMDLAVGVILAFIIFLMVRQMNRLKRAAPPPEVVTPEDTLLLRQIRDSLRPR